MKPIKLLFVGMAVLALISLACNFISGEGGSVPVAPGAQAPDEPARPAGGAQATEVVSSTPEATSPEAAPSSGEAPLTQIDDVSKGLSELESYRMELKMTFEGVDNNAQAQSGSIEMEQAHFPATGNTKLSIKTEDSSTAEEVGDVEYYIVDGVTYMSGFENEEQKCFSFSGGEEVAEEMDVTQPFNSLKDLKLVERSVEVNGVLTDHYTFDEKSFPEGNYETAQGDVWIAQSGAYVVKMEGSGTGKIQFNWEGNGTTTWEYQIKDINQLENITPPENCSAPASLEIPIPDNAANQISMDNFVSFESPDAPSALASYYQEQLPPLGWTLDSQQEYDKLFLLVFTKEGGKLSLTISGLDNGGSSVILLQEP